MYYKQVELQDGNLVQFVGVYVTKWRREFGEPDFGFIEDDTVPDLIEALETFIRDYDEQDGNLRLYDGPLNEARNKAMAALAKARPGGE